MKYLLLKINGRISHFPLPTQEFVDLFQISRKNPPKALSALRSVQKRAESVNLSCESVKIDFLSSIGIFIGILDQKHIIKCVNCPILSTQEPRPELGFLHENCQKGGALLVFSKVFSCKECHAVEHTRVIFSLAI